MTTRKSLGPKSLGPKSLGHAGAVRSWGGVDRVRHQVLRPVDSTAAARGAADGPVLAHGCGRSYGDVALNAEGRLIQTRGLDRFLAFDPTTGVLDCEAGVTLADILVTLCRPEADGGGWFLPVSPGSRFISVGGAIANDVHGKNHHAFGTFGRHVLAFDLARSDGRLLTCSPTQNAGLFAATIGGLGLTGLILRASLQMRRVPGLAMEAEDIRFGGLGDFFALSAQSDGGWEYTAAWVDCLATGADLGRGIFSRARHAPGIGAPPPSRAPLRSFPVTPPMSLANTLSVRAFNAAYVRRPGLGRRIGGYEAVLYPLDAIGRWNRIYGRAGFYQFQCVVPKAAAQDAVAEMLRRIAGSGQGSMLSVLKLFGDLASPGMLSFPMPGATLALDFPNLGAATRTLLGDLERIAMAAGGRIYPAKDSTMSSAAMRAGYPEIDTFLGHIDLGFSSSFARRVGLLPASPPSGPIPMTSDTPVVALFGATSDIAASLARRYAEARSRLVLVARDADALAAQAADLRVRGAPEVAVIVSDFADLPALPALANGAWGQFGRLDVAILAYGTLPDQAAAERSQAAAEAALRINFTSPVLLLGALATRFEAQGSGALAAISSVAGDRGRKSNHVYGAAKGGLQTYLEGLRHRLHAAGVSVTDVRPGFVATKMTAHLDRKGPLWATPEKVAADIASAVGAGRAVLYTPWFWRGIMAVIRAVPRAVFHRTQL